VLLGLSAQESRLANLAIRADASDAEPLIVGFNVGAGAEKTILIRAVGPTLAIFGVGGPLADPRLELFASGGRKIGENDNHVAADGAVFAQVGAFDLPKGSKDAVMVARLGPGSYTAHVIGAPGSRGTALVEVYEVGSSGTRLTNLSARARVGTGDAILIPGVVISPGATSRQLLVRAVGPGLQPFGVTGLLADPKLELYQGGTRIAENDNWESPVGVYAATAETLKEAFRGSGAFPLPTGSRDAAIYTSLPPGGFTLQVSGADGQTGAALVEVYDLTGESEPPVQLASKLFFTTLRPAAGAGSSTASGFASITLNPDGVALVASRLSNLSSPQTSAYLRLAGTGEYLLALPAGQMSQREWRIDAVGAYSRNDILRALNEGRVYLTVGSARFPDAEVAGTLIAATGSQRFVAPPAAPVMSTAALTSPQAADAARFLTQATFGPTTPTIEDVRRVGIPAWIRAQQALPATSVLGLLREDVTRFPNPDRDQNGPFPRVSFDYQMNFAWWKLVLASPDQLRQRVAWALSQIFVVGLVGVNDRAEPAAQYYDIFVQEAFGNFRTIMERVSLHPEMAWYLTYLRNQKADPAKGTSPDENYAREIQQLFTIGLVQLQPDGTLLLDAQGLPIPTYDNITITETAKVFTGWAYRNRDNSFYNDPQWEKPGGYDAYAFYADSNGRMQPLICYDAFHDRTAKRVISLEQRAPREATPTTIPAGQTGEEDLRMLLDTLFRHPNTGPFVCRQLIQRLVTSNPSPGYVHRVAGVFADNGKGIRGDMGAVVTAILTDYEARSPDVAGNAGFGKVKEPLLRATALLRALGTRAPNGRFANSYFGNTGSFNPQGFFSSVRNANDAFGQSFFGAPSVFNFYSPSYSAPGALAEAGLVAPEMQITDATLAIRTPNYLTRLIYLQPPDETTAPKPSPYFRHDFSELLALSGSVPSLVERLNLLFCSGQMTDSTRRIVSDLLNGMAVKDPLKNAPTPASFVMARERGPLLQPDSSTAFDPKGSFTMEGWFNPSSSQTENACWLMGKSGPQSPYLLQIRAVSSAPAGDKPVFRVSPFGPASNTWLMGPDPLPLGKWSHIAAVLDGLTMRLYVNGVEVARRTTEAGAPAAPAEPFAVGDFHGGMSQLRFWNVARSAAQIAQGMKELEPSDRTGLVASWALNQSEGSVVTDSSGNGLSLRASSAPTWVRNDGTSLDRVRAALHVLMISQDAATQR
jgi:uncharacterized protein (DUF1800 family)